MESIGNMPLFIQTGGGSREFPPSCMAMQVLELLCTELLQAGEGLLPQPQQLSAGAREARPFQGAYWGITAVREACLFRRLRGRRCAPLLHQHHWSCHGPAERPPLTWPMAAAVRGLREPSLWTICTQNPTFPATAVQPLP